MRKYIVLVVLFILPITAYVFFSLSTNYFRLLPVLTPNVSELYDFENLNGESVRLEEHITVLGFFGKDLESNRAYAYNLAHKIYGKNRLFEDFQFVILLPKGTEDQAKSIDERIKDVAPTDRWHFAFGDEEAILKVFNSLQVPFSLDSDYATSQVFIIDRERALRGRDDDEDFGMVYGYDSKSIAEINNKMSDDVKVLLAEYRRALKKYSSGREI